MKTQIAKRTLSLLLTVCMLATSLMMPIFAETWSATSSVRIYVATNSDTIDIYDSNEPVVRYANLFAKEYQSKFGITPYILYGAKEKAKSGDIVLDLNPDNGIAKEGYSISVSSSRLIVSASDYSGLLYGYHDVLKQLLVDGTVEPVTNNAPDVAERSISLDNGRKYFSPDWIKELIREMSWAGMNTLVLHFSEEMGLGLESKTYPWLAGRDGTLCTQNYYTTIDSSYLTHEELLDLAEYAELYNVELVPSLDSPGHLNYLVKKFNATVRSSSSDTYSFTYNGNTYKTVYSGGTYKFYVNNSLKCSSKYGIGNYLQSGSETQVVQGTSVVGSADTKSHSRGIDISNPVAVAFVQSLIVEYGNLFRKAGTSKIDIGGDELLGFGSALTTDSGAPRYKWAELPHWKQYAINRTGNSNAVAYDAFLLYMNDLNALVRSLGYTQVRMWNDDALRKDITWNKVVKLDSNIDIWYWDTNTNTVTAYTGAGHNVYNILSDYTYYVLTNDYLSTNRGSFKKAYADKIYNEWSPYKFDVTNSNKVLGGALGIWCDDPTLRTPAQVMEAIKPMFRALAAKSWNTTANSSKSYSTFTSEWKKIGNAPVVEIPDDDTLKALIAEFYQTYLPKEDTYTVSSFALYEEEVINAEKFIGLNSVCWSADTFNLLGSNIQEYRDMLVPLGDASLILEAMAIYENLVAEKDKYSIESWSEFEASYIACQKMLAGRNYSQGAAKMAKINMELFPMMTLILEADVADLRKEAINSAGFQTSTVYQGTVARLTVVVPRSSGVKEVRVVDENGIVVAYGKAQPINIRKPRQITYIVNIPVNELGTYTYTVYATHAYTGTSTCNYLYCSDPVQCTITVIE